MFKQQKMIYSIICETSNLSVCEGGTSRITRQVLSSGHRILPKPPKIRRFLELSESEATIRRPLREAGVRSSRNPPPAPMRRAKALQFSKEAVVDDFQGDQFPDSQQHQVLGVSSLSLASWYICEHWSNQCCTQLSCLPVGTPIVSVCLSVLFRPS